MIFDFKDYRLYGEIKKDSRYSKIESIPFPLSALIPCTCENCNKKAEYHGIVAETGERVLMCFDDMLKELDLSPNADELIKAMRRNS